ncbi:unnamed protein product [Amoebophrya sp. A25]|nr:unnamed protein product [Amoebophrya sp. A25]|eukprot:GSA25T00000589001.1
MMDSYVNRVATVFYTWLTAFGLAACFCHCSSYVFSPVVDVQIANVWVQDFTYNNYLGQEQASLAFDMDADLTNEFNWNLKQLFVYLVVTYESESNQMNEVIIWDDIIRDKDSATLKFRKESAKYPLRDQHRDLKGTKASLVLRYRRMPIIGVMGEVENEQSRRAFKMPERYFRSQKPVKSHHEKPDAYRMEYVS